MLSKDWGSTQVSGNRFIDDRERTLSDGFGQDDAWRTENIPGHEAGRH